MRILLVNNAMGATVAGLAALAVWQAPSAAQWAALAAIGAMMVTGQAFYLGAMRAADASFVAPLFYLTLAYAALFDFAVFGTLPDAVSLTGALVLVAGAGLLAWREGRAARPQALRR
jgi:drug/metabolite transporter (DMT)-like permease